MAKNFIGLHHAGVVVPDLDAAIQFYCDMFGFEVLSTGSWGADNENFNQIVGLESSAARFCMLKGTNSFLELFEYADAAGSVRPINANETGIRHLCMAVHDVDKALADCERLGGSRINAPVSVPGGATSSYCRDPFGNLLELVAPAGRFPDPIVL